MRKNVFLRSIVAAFTIVPAILFTTSANAQVALTGPFWNTPGNSTTIPTYTDGNVWIGNNNPTLVASVPGSPANQHASLNIETGATEIDNVPSISVKNYRWSTPGFVNDDNVVQIYGHNLTTRQLEPYFFIDGEGRTHIGIDPTKHTSPPGFQLYVRHGILTERVKVTTHSPGCATCEWPDYVFADNYELMSLGQLEAFVNENKHLPNVPSAEEVDKDGIDLAEMDARLLRKIEELTLYVIDLKKDNEDLRKQVNELKK